MNNAMNIIRSCEVADSLWTDVDSLRNSLDQLIGESIQERKFPDYKSAGNPKDWHQESASGWMRSATANSFPLMENNKRKANPSVWLSYQISLFGEGVPQIDDVEKGEISYAPALHIWLWHVPIDENAMVSFPCEHWSEWAIKDDRLLYWDESDANQIDSWIFSLRLLDMDSEDTLRKSVIAPIQALLTGAKAKQALPDDLKGLIRYQNKDLGNGKATIVVKLDGEIG